MHHKTATTHQHDHTDDHQHPQTSGITMSRRARRYDLITGLISGGRERRFRKSILDLAGLSAGEHVLDVGCGTGTLALMAKERTGPAGVVVGLDATPEMIEQARQKQQKRGLDLHFMEGVIEQMPFTDDHFDVVFSTFMLHHLPDDIKRQGLAEIRRVLKPDGRLVVVDFSFHLPSLAAVFHQYRDDEDRSVTIAGFVEEAGFSQVQTGWTVVKGAFYVSAVNDK